MKYLLVCCLLVGYFVSGCTLNTKEVFLIPEGFRGKIVVSFNHHQDGTKQEFEPSAYVYRIPSDGKLFSAHVNDRCDNPIQERSFFYLKSDGKRVPIPVAEPGKKISDAQIAVRNFRTAAETRKYPPYNLLQSCTHTFIIDTYPPQSIGIAKDSLTLKP